MPRPRSTRRRSRRRSRRGRRSLKNIHQPALAALHEKSGGRRPVRRQLPIPPQRRKQRCQLRNVEEQRWTGWDRASHRRSSSRRCTWDQARARKAGPRRIPRSAKRTIRWATSRLDVPRHDGSSNAASRTSSRGAGHPANAGRCWRTSRRHGGSAAWTCNLPQASAALQGATQQLDGAEPQGMTSMLLSINDTLAQAYLMAAMRVPDMAEDISKARSSLARAIKKAQEASKGPADRQADCQQRGGWTAARRSGSRHLRATRTTIPRNVKDSHGNRLEKAA